MTCTLLSASFFLAFCVLALAAGSANVFTFVSVAFALFCASFFCAFSVQALAAGSANVFTFVSVAFALFCASFFCAFSVQALAALFTLALAEVRSLGESDAGKSYLCAYLTVAVEEATRNVAVSVGGYNEVLAVLQRCKCFLEVACCCARTIGDAIIFSIKVLCAGTVVNTNDLSILIEYHCYAVAVAKGDFALVCRSKDEEEIFAQKVNICIYCNGFGKSLVGIAVDGKLDKSVNNLNLTGNGNGILTVGCSQCNGVNADRINVKSAVVVNGNFNDGFIFKIKLYVVGNIKGSVIILDNETVENSGCKIKRAIGKASKNLIAIAGDNRSLVNVRSENLLGISPKEANNVTVLVNNVVVHKATAVGVNGGSAVAVLNNDCIAACRNGEVLCKCACNSNGFTINLNGAYSTCDSFRVCSVYELVVCAVATFNYKAVCINYSCYTVAACNVDGNSSIGCVVEYATDCYFGYVITGDSYELLVFEGKEVARPLGITK